MLAALLLTASLAPQPCDTAPRFDEVRSIRKRLFALPEAGDDQIPYDVPDVAQQEIPALRVALSEAVTAFMQCDAGMLRDPAVIQARLSSVLGVPEPATTNDDDTKLDHTYGDGLQVKVGTLPRLPDALTFDISFYVACSDDHILLVFQRSDATWQRTLDWHGDKYVEASDAFGDFFLFTAVPGADDKTLLLVARGEPWCSSRFSGFKVDLIEPGTQRKVDHVDSEYMRFGDEPTLSNAADGVSLHADSMSRDFDNLDAYLDTFHYRTTNGKLERLPEFDNARDFVNSWLGQPWDIAASWSKNPNTALEDFHKTFDMHEDKKPEATEPAQPSAPTDPEDSLEFTYGPVRACTLPKGSKGAARQTQVEIDLNSFKDDDKDVHILVRVEQRGQMFSMLSAGPKADPSCGGPDLMPKKSD